MPGELLGYRAFLALEPYSASAELREPARVCRFGRPAFEGLLRASQQASLSLIRSLSRELRGMRDDLLSRRDESAEERLLRCLAQHPPDPRSRAAPLKRGELANMVGVAAETVSRILKRLQAEKMVELRGADIVLLRPALPPPGAGQAP